jgi:hypothetical protein
METEGNKYEFKMLDKNEFRMVAKDQNQNNGFANNRDTDSAILLPKIATNSQASL